MDRDQPSSTTAFNKLPIELNKAIAHCLDSDQDIANFGFICKQTNNAIDGDNLSFWRAKFREKYAFQEGTPNDKLKRKYQVRRQALRLGTGLCFYRGHLAEEVKVMGVLRGLITESFQGAHGFDEYGRPRCPNQEHLIKFILNSKVFLSSRRPPPPLVGEPNELNPELAAIKIMCSQFLFDLEGTKHMVFATEESQEAVYAPTNAAPLFVGFGNSQVNMVWFLHCLNFFRNHMMSEDMGTLYNAMSELDVPQRPSAWRAPLKQGCYPLSKHWKGTYAFLESAEIDRLRRRQPRPGDIFMDRNVEEGKLQTLELDFVESGALPWPKLFEDRLKSHRETLPPRTRAQHRNKSKSGPSEEKLQSIQVTGSGEDLDDEFYASGWLNPLAPQFGIPGWQRVTLMKHFLDDLDQIDQDDLWAYEGVVLPGGRIMLGRWWYATEEPDFDHDYNGPFIFWAVDPEPDPDEGE